MTDGWHNFQRVLARPTGLLMCWFGAFAVLGLLEAVQVYAGQSLEEFSISWGTALRRSVESHGTMAVLGLGVLWFSGRFPFDRARPWRWAGVHLLGALVYALVYSLIYAALVNGQMSVKGKPFVFGETFRKLIVFYTYGNVVFYWLLLLAHQGWHYYQRYRDRERRAAELEGQLAQAQLEALRMQLNPHFLFNTLNTIAALIHEQPDAADRTLTRLSELLRLSLAGAATQEIPLRQELGFLERYLEIEQARFGDRLQVTVEVPDFLRDALVPALLLQPIVENAIRHGVERREQAGRVTLRGARHDNQLLLVVDDNGPGLPEGAAGFQREGIGLSNTRSRLRHLYGENQRLDLRPADDGGLEVHLTLPFRLAADEPVQPRRPAAPAAAVSAHPHP